MKTKLIKTVTLTMVTAMLMATGCSGKTSFEEFSGDPSEIITLNADFGKIVDPPLLKKVAQYNAGCIQPLFENYDRDWDRIDELYADSFRIDLTVGKDEGTAGQVVTDDYEIYDWNQETDHYKVDKNSLNYDFTRLDKVVKYMSDHNILPYMSWCYIPAPLQVDGNAHNLDNNIDNWQEVWEEIYYNYAKHYRDAGVKIGYHEIFNEPDLEILKIWGAMDEDTTMFLDIDDFAPNGDPSKGVYNDMYEYGAKGILRADPDATIGGPAFALGEIGVEGWVGFLNRVISKNLPLDFYSFHTYMDGETWFISDERRAEGITSELEKVIAGLSKDDYFLKTALHITEYNWLNDQTGSSGGLMSPYNYYTAAPKTLDTVMEAVNRTQIQWVHWAQFMESTAGYDPYGLIEHVNGNVKAAFNALKIYADMPVWRYESTFSKENTGLKSMVSSSDDKISLAIWNNNSPDEENGDRFVKIDFDNAKFQSGKRRVYRIDETHASYFDNKKSPELVAEQVGGCDTGDLIWQGTVPAGGVVYITVNKDGAEDFKAYENTSVFADDIKTSYWYEDRYRGLEGSRQDYADYAAGLSGSYSHFDRKSWTMYLGMGSATGIDGAYEGQAHASSSVIVRDLPMKFTVDLSTEGNVRMLNKNSTLGFRVDFFDEESGTYVKSVYFHNGLYRDSRNPNAQDEKLAGLPAYPWGTEKAPDEVVEFDGNIWDIDLSLYAPEGWSSSDKAMLSFDMQNTGANTRAMFRLYK